MSEAHRALQLVSETEAIDWQLRNYQEIENNEIFTQAGMLTPEASEGIVKLSEENQTLLDIVGAQVDNGSSGKAIRSDQGQKNVLSVEEFLARPVIIHSDNHAVGTNVYEVLDVWNLFTLVPSVRAKLKNFAYLKATLKVRITVSGSPFHYGRILFSYQPCPQVNAGLTNLAAMASVFGGGMQPFIGYLSQARGSAFVNVNENRPLEMSFPYISPKPMHRLYNNGAGAIAAVDPYLDLQFAGDLYIVSTGDIEAVGSSDTPIAIQVYAWMEDVELGTNTGTHIAITTESGEMKEGPVQRITSRMVKVSKALERVAFISPYATASTLFLSGINKMATIMGWSRPVLVNNVEARHLIPYGRQSHTIGNDTCERIVLDPMQEVDVDPLVCGTDTDEMVIQHIAARPSYVETITWDPDDVALSTILGTYLATPSLGAVGQVGMVGRRITTPTAMCFAATPFRWWRGDIIFRFDVVASQFHRGKLAVFYEPNLAQLTTILGSLSINKQYVRIVDIQETTTFEIRVNWASARAWLKTSPANSVYLNTDLVLTSAGNDFGNGAVIVTPFTEIQSPDGSGVTINVFAYSDNLQVNMLDSYNMPTGRELVTESGDISSLMSTDFSCFDLNPSTATSDKICSTYFGEQPISFRSLLKRYVTVANYVATVVSSPVRASVNVPYIPDSTLPFGDVTGTVTDLFTYLRYAYLGVKGGTRHLVVTDLLPTNTYPPFYVTLAQPGTSFTAGVTLTTGIVPMPSAEMRGTSTWGPLALMGHPKIEMPFYTANQFYYSGSETLDDGNVAANSMEHSFVRGAVCEWRTGTTAVTNVVTVQSSTGEDFSFMRFLGSPYYSAVV